MISLLKKSSYLKSPWKNGKGKTLQIAIFPDDATVVENNFLWRISSAEVNQADPFSIFLDCERRLIVWQGSGLLLNGKTLLPDTPIHFSGEEAIDCKLKNEQSPVVDLGIIYKRNSIKADLDVLVLKPPLTLKLEPATHFLFLAKGEDCLINGHQINPGDTLRASDQKELYISAKEHVTIYHIRIF